MRKQIASFGEHFSYCTLVFLMLCTCWFSYPNQALPNINLKQKSDLWWNILIIVQIASLCLKLNHATKLIPVR